MNAVSCGSGGHYHAGDSVVGVGGSVPCSLRVATSVTRYRSCTVDPGPSRVVHCPDLNACLINEGRSPSKQVDCNAVHFGYAIPVKVVPTGSELAQLVLDSENDLSSDTLSYLIQRHPQLRDMATTAAEPEEDIAAIAKQISDHAEAIYQTWKSRGLAPTEILNCHSSGANRFKPALTPTVRQTNQQIKSQNVQSNQSQAPYQQHSNQQTKSSTPPVAELLSSEQTNSLERLVSNFVSEDKARQAAAVQNCNAQHKTLPSSIQFALQKFERKAAAGANIPLLTPSSIQQQNRSPLLNNSTAAKHGLSGATTANSKYLTSSNNDRDTIEVIYPDDVNVAVNTKTVNNTWPLKNKVQDNKRTSPTNNNSGNNAYHYSGDRSFNKSAQRHSAPCSQAEYLDEVAKEEERLINALKTGMIIAEDPTSSLKRNKPAVTSVQPHSPSPASQVTAAVDQVDKSSGVISGISNGSSGVIRRGRHTSADNVPHLSSALSRTPAPALNPVRPFLTRGSVAERVLIFEKCPTEILEKRVKSTTPPWKTSAAAANAADIQHNRSPNYSRESVSSSSSSSGHKSTTSVSQHAPHTTLQRHTKANRNLLIPRFHYPNGKPCNQQQIEQTCENIKQAFLSLQNHQATKDTFGIVTKAAGCPLYWKAPLFIACGGEKLGYVELHTFIDYWRSVCSTCHDDASKFVRILRRGQNKNYLYPEDFMPLIQDVVDTHPGLTFLKEAAEFHSRYVLTVISRIYYCVNQSWSGQISLSELRRSDLLRVIEMLQAEEDINQVTQYFSYEHFYVIYCKFWELDRDHDLYIDKQDLARHSDHEFKAFIRRVTHPTPNRVLTSLSTRLIDRIFSGTVTRGSCQQSQLNGQVNAKMSYTEFVWFLLAEEDKMHPRAIEYWFRCMDLDGDGYLSMYELEYFYDEQLQRMEAIGIECLPFEDCLCQMLDMIRPTIPGKISLGDLKRCKMTPIFFDTFFNLEKYLDHEQRDPFASQRDHDTEMSDWDRYAAEEYELLVAEEGGNDNHDDILYEEDEEEDDLLSPNLDEILSTQTFLNNNTHCSRSNKKKHNNNNNNISLKIGVSDGDSDKKPVPLLVTDEETLEKDLQVFSNGTTDDPTKVNQRPCVSDMVTDDFDDEEGSSSDYAADSDDCSL